MVALGVHQNVKKIATLATSTLILLTQSGVACQMCKTTYCCLFLLLACQISLIVISCDRFGQRGIIGLLLVEVLVLGLHPDVEESVLVVSRIPTRINILILLFP